MSLAEESRAVVLLTGNPRVEEERKALPRGFLTALHRELSRSVRAILGVDLILAADTRSGFQLTSNGDEALHPCSEIGAKLQASIDFAADRGYANVVLLAGDVAGLRPGLLEDTFVALEGNADCVIAPSGDGGFSLVGLHADARIDWSAIPWFTNRAADGLRNVIDRSRMTRVELDRLDDIDDRASALRVAVRQLSRIRALLLGLLTIKLPSIPTWLRDDKRIPITSTRLRAPPLLFA